MHRILDAQQNILQIQGGNDSLVGANTLAVLQGEPTKEEPLYKKTAEKISNQPLTGHPFTATPGKSQYATPGDDYLSLYKDLDYLIDWVGQSLDRVNAVRTPPANANKYKKQLGAKASKNLEKLESIGFELNPTEATLYRALSARCNYLAQHRCDIAYAAKQLCRNLPSPLSIIMQN